MDVVKLFIQLIVKQNSLIKRLLTKEQLYKKGISGSGSKITPGYAASTIKAKKRKRLPTSRVTLYQSGSLHSSYKVYDEKNEIEGKFGHSEKSRGFSLREHLIKRYGKDIEALTDENEKKVIDKIKYEMLSKVNIHINKLLQNVFE